MADSNEKIKSIQIKLLQAVSVTTISSERPDFEAIGKLLTEYTKELRNGIPSSTPFQLFKIAPEKINPVQGQNVKPMVVIDLRQPGDVSLPGANSPDKSEIIECPNCGYKFGGIEGDA